MGALTLVNKPAMFPVQLMQSREYVRAGIALIGDAAHCCHPVGGQGLNMGIRDATALAEVLQQAASRGENIGSLIVLKRYQRWRRTENWFTLSLTDLLNRSFFQPVFTAAHFASCWHLDSRQRWPAQALNPSADDWAFFGRLPLKAR